MSDYAHGIEGPTTKVLQYNTDASGKVVIKSDLQLNNRSKKYASRNRFG